MLWSLLLASTSLAAAPPPLIPPIELVGVDDLFRVTVAEFDAPLLMFVEAAVRARAIATCGERTVDWGNFSIGGRREKPATGMPALTDYRREFRCLDVRPEPVARAPDDWRPDAADKRDVRRFFNAFYVRRDSGSITEVAALFEPGVLKDQDQWGRDLNLFNAARGPGARRISGLTWFVNPPGERHAGVFAAIEFTGDFPAFPVYCGYLGLWRRGPGDYLVVREQQGIVERGKDAPDAAYLAEARAAFCRD